jgi:hypothetical protein
MRKTKRIRARGKQGAELNAATKRAIREVQSRVGLETFETVSDWAKTVRKIASSSVERTRRK